MRDVGPRASAARALARPGQDEHRSVARHRRQHRRRPVVSSEVPVDQRIVSRRESRHFDVGDNAARVRTMPYDADVTMQAWRRARPRQGVVMVMAMVLVGVVTSCQPGGMFQQPRIEQPVPTASGPPPPLADDPQSQLERLHADLVQRRAALALPTRPPPAEDACAPVCSVDDPPGLPSRSAEVHTRKLRPRRAQEVCAQADAACDDARRRSARSRKQGCAHRDMGQRPVAARRRRHLYRVRMRRVVIAESDAMSANTA